MLGSRNETFDQEYRIQKKNCEWIWVHDRAARTHQQNGILFADGIFSDITARKRAEQELLAASIYTRHSSAAARVLTCRRSLKRGFVDAIASAD